MPEAGGSATVTAPGLWAIPVYQGWFYMDENQGMLTGWQFINGKWYYLNSNHDGSAGIMYSNRRTPDGWYVKEDGSWDEEAGR